MTRFFFGESSGRDRAADSAMQDLEALMVEHRWAVMVGAVLLLDTLILWWLWHLEKDKQGYRVVPV